MLNLLINTKPPKQTFISSLIILNFLTNITAQLTHDIDTKPTLTIDKVHITTDSNFVTPSIQNQAQKQANTDLPQEPLYHQQIPQQIPHPHQQQQQQQQPILTQIIPYPIQPPPTQTQTQLVYLSPPRIQQGASPFLHPLAVILILCSILGFISVLITLPFNLSTMSSSSSSAKPSSSSSSSKPSSSSSSSSSSKPSSSSSSSSSPKPPAPQPVPTISANAWMSFFLFCCLVLIILQGPLGLTGNSVLPTLPFTNPGLGGFGGIGGIGGMPGCIGVASNYVPWCNQQQPQQPQQNSQIQIQQVVQQPNPNTGNGFIPGANAQFVGAGPQMGGQGGFAAPGGGGGWSWYANGAGQVIKQQPAYYNPQQERRSVQYQRPGLQIQINNARGGGGGVGGVAQPVAPYPNYYYTCPTTYQYAYAYNQYCYYAPQYYTNTYSTSNRCTPWQPWNCNYLPNVFAYAQSVPDPHYHNGLIDVVGGNVGFQSQHFGSPPVQAVPVAAPQPMLPNPPAIAGLANLENAFYPLLVGAIALLVVFDYAS